MDKLNKVEVFYHDRKVGTLALYERMHATFEYDSTWLSEGFSISPISLPLKPGVFIPKIDPFEGLFGVFSDSLPDGWGRLLVDRLMKKNGVDPYSVGNLERLAIVGQSGMGALTYRPVIELKKDGGSKTLDEIASECEKILKTNDQGDLDYLFKNGGSSGGARPKILTEIDCEDWIVKFPSSEDDPEIGRQEYEYALAAKECGIEMEKVMLLSSRKCDGYFATKRFDRCGKNINDRTHMISASGILETSHRIPNLDYNLLMRLTLKLTGSMEECEKLYRRMCFNVFSHNRDDHSKNFTYQYIEKDDRWILSPAYDMTYSNSIGGEHATTVNGNGVNPSIDDLLCVAKIIGLSQNKSRIVANEIKEIVYCKLKEYL